MPLLTRRLALAAGTAAVSAAVLPARAASDAPLKGKAFLITGSSSGFGRAGAEHYARLGARVFATMRNLPRPEADDLRALARRDKLDIHVLPLDVTSDAEVTAAVVEAERINRGPLDVLVNNAGIGITGPIEVQDMAATRLAFDTNVFGVQRTIRAALPGMRARKSGLIVNVSSQLGRVIVPAGGHYSPTKFALEALSEQLAYEVAAHGIQVLIVQPGGYPTRVWENRNRYNLELKPRIEAERVAAYPAMIARMGTETGGGRTADVLDVPRAIAEVAAMAPSARPLRRAVHPGRKPQEAINRVSAETQLAMLGDSAFGPVVRDVLD